MVSPWLNAPLRYSPRMCYCCHGGWGRGNGPGAGKMRPRKAFCSFNTDYRASHLVYLEHFGNGVLNFPIICMQVSSSSPPSLWGSPDEGKIRAGFWGHLLPEKLVGKLVSRDCSEVQGVLSTASSPQAPQTWGHGGACL